MEGIRRRPYLRVICLASSHSRAFFRRILRFGLATLRRATWLPRETDRSRRHPRGVDALPSSAPTVNQKIFLSVRVCVFVSWRVYTMALGLFCGVVAPVLVQRASAEGSTEPTGLFNLWVSVSTHHFSFFLPFSLSRIDGGEMRCPSLLLCRCTIVEQTCCPDAGKVIWGEFFPPHFVGT